MRGRTRLGELMEHCGWNTVGWNTLVWRSGAVLVGGAAACGRGGNSQTMKRWGHVNPPRFCPKPRHVTMVIQISRTTTLAASCRLASTASALTSTTAVYAIDSRVRSGSTWRHRCRPRPQPPWRLLVLSAASSAWPASCSTSRAN